MPQQRHLTETEAWSVTGRLEWGKTQAEVAEATGVWQSVIFRFCKCFFAGGKPD